MAIRRKVYDVTSGKSFYGPGKASFSVELSGSERADCKREGNVRLNVSGGPYEIFAGRDASRGLAKQSFEEDMLVPVEGEIDGLEDLTKSEWENLTGWESESTLLPLFTTTRTSDENGQRREGGRGSKR